VALPPIDPAIDLFAASPHRWLGAEHRVSGAIGSGDHSPAPTWLGDERFAVMVHWSRVDPGRDPWHLFNGKECEWRRSSTG
jgi:hypothetical protein